MVGDSVPSTSAAPSRSALQTVLYAPDGNAPTGEADVVVGSFAELARLAGVA